MSGAAWSSWPRWPARGLPTRVTLADVVAVHADPDDVPDDGADPDDDLGWYATQEIADLLGDQGN